MSVLRQLLLMFVLLPGIALAAYDYGAINELIVRKEFVLAETALKERVARGETEAMFRLASMYRTGQGVFRRLDDSARLFADAAERGHLRAMYMLAQCYERGIGVESNAALARHWYEEAAARGDERAQTRLQTLGSRQRNLFEALAQWGDAPTTLARVADADLSSRDTHDRTLLIAAVAADAPEVAAKLIERGVDVNAIDRSGRSALFYAVERDDSQIVHMLIAAGAQVAVADETGNTALHLAASRGSTAIATSLAQAGARPDAVNADDWSALDIAIARDDEAMVSALRSFGAMPKRNLGGSTPTEQLAVLQRGQQFAGFSPIALAAWLGDEGLVRERLRTDAVDSSGSEGHTALYWAVVRNHAAVVDQLLAAGANARLSLGAEGTLVHVALMGNHDAIARRLIDAGANFADTDRDGATSLMLAIRRGAVEVALSLLVGGAPVNQTDSNGVSPLMAAATCQRCVQALLDRGARVDTFDTLERSALWFAAGESNVEVVEMLMAHGATFLADRDGVSPLHRAATSGSPAVVAALLRGGHTVDPLTSSGSSPLAIAAARGATDIVSQLVTAGADVNVRDGAGDTPLHKAARNGQLDVARALLDGGAKPELRNYRQANVFDIAGQRNDTALLALLDEHRSVLARLIGGRS